MREPAAVVVLVGLLVPVVEMMCSYEGPTRDNPNKFSSQHVHFNPPMLQEVEGVLHGAFGRVSVHGR